jgi:hypothetical protein
MASLAPHVSRTVKEYAPHGFSIYQDVCIPLGFLSATSQDIPLTYAEDSDYYIEKVSLCSGIAQPAHGSNYWDMSIKNAGTAGTGTAELFVWNNDSGDGNTPLVKNVFLELPLESGANRILADGESLKVTFTKAASAVNAHFTLQIRYRRKA